MIRSHKTIDKVILVGDIHFGAFSNSQEWLIDTVAMFRDFIIPVVRKVVDKYGKEKTTIIFEGDINDIKQAISTIVQNKQIEIFEILAQLADIYILTGNHDTPYKENPTINSIKSLGLIDGIHIVEGPERYEIVGGRSIGMMPWVYSKDVELSYIDKLDTNYLVAHTEIFGFHYEGVPVEESKHNPISAFAKYDRVYSGHIHKKQEKDNILFTGTPRQLKRSEINNENGIYYIDFEARKETFIPNNISPKFKIIPLLKLMEMKISEANEFVRNSYVTVVVPSDLTYKVDISTLSTILSGFRTIEPLSMSTKDADKDIEQFVASVGGEMQIGSVLIPEKLKEYLNEIEAVRINSEQIVSLDDDLRNKLSDSLIKLYYQAESKVEIFEDAHD